MTLLFMIKLWGHVNKGERGILDTLLTFSIWITLAYVIERFNQKNPPNQKK